MKDWREQFDYVGPFSEGRSRVRLGIKWGHVDREGNVTTPIIYDDVWPFYEGRARVRLGNKSFYVDKNGNKIKEE